MTETETRPFPRYFRHKMINHFVFGPFQFRKHLLKIDTQEDYDDWMNHFKGLLEVDQVNIVEVMNIENERSLPVTSNVIRGGLNTSNTAGDLSGPAGQTEAQRRLEEQNRQLQEQLAEALKAVETLQKAGESKPTSTPAKAPEEANETATESPESPAATSNENTAGGLKLGGVKIGG